MSRRAEIAVAVAAACLAAIGVLRCVAIIDAAREGAGEVWTLSAEDGRCPLEEDEDF